MDRLQATSHEKLNQMLASGAITAGDYERLTEAMHARDSAANAPAEAGTRAIGRWRRNWAHRQIAGVCAGIADHFGLDPTVVRLVAVILALVACPVTLLGYLVLSLALPWDDPAAARQARGAAHPWRAVLTFFLLLEALPFCLGLFVPLPIAATHVRMGPGFPAMLLLAMSVFYVVSSVAFITGILTAIYLAWRRSASRLLYVALWVVAVWSFSSLVFLGHSWPLLIPKDAIR